RQQRGIPHAMFDKGHEAAGSNTAIAQDTQRNHRCRQTPESQPTRQGPVDIAFLVMNMDAAGLGDGGIQQVGPHRAGWCDTEVEQDWRHQRAATHTGHPNNKTNNQTGDYKSVLEIHKNLAGPGANEGGKAISRSPIIKIAKSLYPIRKRNNYLTAG